MRALIPAKTIKGKEKAINKESLSTGSDTNVSSEEEWNEEDKGGSSSPATSPSKKRKKGNLKGKCVAKKIVLQESESHSVGNDTDVISGGSQSKGNIVFNGQDFVVEGRKKEGMPENVEDKEAKEFLQRTSKRIAKLKK